VPGPVLVMRSFCSALSIGDFLRHYPYGRLATPVQGLYDGRLSIGS
jgi:hypothetical protein